MAKSILSGSSSGTFSFPKILVTTVAVAALHLVVWALTKSPTALYMTSAAVAIAGLVAAINKNMVLAGAMLASGATGGGVNFILNKPITPNPIVFTKWDPVKHAIVFLTKDSIYHQIFTEYQSNGLTKPAYAQNSITYIPTVTVAYLNPPAAGNPLVSLHTRMFLKSQDNGTPLFSTTLPVANNMVSDGTPQYYTPTAPSGQTLGSATTPSGIASLRTFTFTSNNGVSVTDVTPMNDGSGMAIHKPARQIVYATVLDPLTISPGTSNYPDNYYWMQFFSTAGSTGTPAFQSFGAPSDYPVDPVETSFVDPKGKTKYVNYYRLKDASNPANEVRVAIVLEEPN